MLDPSHAGGDAYAAARIALLALRAAALGGTATDPALVRLAPAAAPDRTPAVARELARLPKPLRVWADVEGGLLVVRWTPLPPPEPPLPLYGPLEEGAFRLSEHPEHQTMGFLIAEHGPAIAHLGVVCVGAGDAVRATVADVWARERDYELRYPDGRVSTGMRTMGPLEAADPPPYLAGVPAALVAGAAAYLAFHPADEDRGLMWWLTPESSPAWFCDECGRRRAFTRLREGEPGAWRERHLCGPCYLADDAGPGDPGLFGWPEPTELEQIEGNPADDSLPDLAAYYVRCAEKSGLPLPPHVAAFVRRHPPDDGA
jgi:hypothetical protein